MKSNPKKGKRMAMGGTASAGTGRTMKGGASVGSKFANAKPLMKGRRMAVGGAVGYGGTKTNDPAGPGGYGGTGNSAVSGGINGGGQGRGGPAGGVTTGTTTGTSATNRPAARPMPGRPVGAPPVMKPPSVRPKLPTAPKANMPSDPNPSVLGIFKRPETGTNWPGQGSRPMGDEGYTPPDVPDEAIPGPQARAGRGAEGRVASMPAFAGRGVMRGGGLAKKGVGQALAKGGMVKGSGCAKRGVKKARYT